MTATNTARNNGRIVLACLLVTAGMIGMSYAAVPLYRLFCQVTGYGGTPRIATNAQGVEILDDTFTIRFDANTAPGLAWRFAPLQRSVDVRLGEITQISYVAENPANRPLAGMATFNITPQGLGAYFNKMECFCFTETTLQPGEKLDMPVVFFIDPAIKDAEEAQGVTTLTLSYTFYAREPESSPAAQYRPSAGSTGG